MSERNVPIPELVAPESPADIRIAVSDPTAITRRAHHRSETAPSDDLVGNYLREIAKEPLLDATEEVALAQQIEAGLAAERIRLLRTDPKPETLYDHLKPKERPIHEQADRILMVQSDEISEEELALLSHAGTQAKDRFIRANLRLVASVAKRYPDIPGMLFLDRIQEGNIGLIKAVEKFDYRQGNKFSTYATWWIRQAISYNRAQQCRTVRLPLDIHDELGRIDRARRELTRKTQADVSVEQIADELDVSPDRVQKTMRLGMDPVSLNKPLDKTEQSNELGGNIVDIDQEPVDKVVVREQFMEVVAGELRAKMRGEGQICLDIMRIYFGLDGSEPTSFKNTAAQLDMSTVRAKRIFNSGKAILGHYLGQSGYQDLFD